MAGLRDETAPAGSAPAATDEGRPLASILRHIGLPFLASRLVLWAVAVFALVTLPASLRQAPEGTSHLESHRFGSLLDIWFRWDTGHYVEIAQSGYDNSFGHASTAFYPLYPTLVGLLGRILGGDYALAGVLVSLVSSVAAGCLLYELARRHLGEEVALRALVFFGVFPYVLFLQAIYSESLFLALALAAFLAAERKQMSVAALCAGLALLTRPTGLAVLVGLAVLAWTGTDRWRDLARLLLAPAVFVVYPLLLWQQIGDPFAFVHAERLWGRSISPWGPLAGIWDGSRAAWFAVRQLLSGSPEHPFWTSVEPDRVAAMNLEILAYVVVVAILSVVAWRKLGAAFGVYALTCLLLALSAPSSTYPYPLLSFPRFALVIFPVFIALGSVVRKPWLFAAIAGTETLLLGVNLVRWAAWQFIA